ncbi:hypothetical protein [Lutibaculum baratangense]|uniref:hypothetical protein n=1 Tax=Lutibaculum baratangense TaxID=1358440 RepID=UPI001268095D|nr:hypothetical protein [Lutibaculum baratangense]
MLKHNYFSHDGRDLEVRAVTDANEIAVRVYEDGKVATMFSYRVSIETKFDASVQGFPIDVIGNLMHLAETDVTEGRVRLLEQSN